MPKRLNDMNQWEEYWVCEMCGRANDLGNYQDTHGREACEVCLTPKRESDDIEEERTHRETCS